MSVISWKRTTQTYTVDSRNQLTAAPNYLSMSYDNNGNLVDADGVLAYEYDAENQMVAADAVERT